LLINQWIRQLLQSIVVVILSPLFTVITTLVVNTSPLTANSSKNRLIRSVLPQFQNNIVLTVNCTLFCFVKTVIFCSLSVTYHWLLFRPSIVLVLCNLVLGITWCYWNNKLTYLLTISFQDFHDPPTSQTDRWTDRWHAISRPRFAL